MHTEHKEMKKTIQKPQNTDTTNMSGCEWHKQYINYNVSDKWHVEELNSGDEVNNI